jgi:hypothetical protein
MTSPLTKSSHPRSSSFSFSSNEGHLASTEDFDDDDDDAGSQLSAPTTTNASNMVDPKSDEFHIMRFVKKIIFGYFYFKSIFLFDIIGKNETEYMQS